MWALPLHTEVLKKRQQTEKINKSIFQTYYFIILLIFYLDGIEAMADSAPNPFLAGIVLPPKCMECHTRLLNGKCGVVHFRLAIIQIQMIELSELARLARLEEDFRSFWFKVGLFDNPARGSPMISLIAY